MRLIWVTSKHTFCDLSALHDPLQLISVPFILEQNIQTAISQEAFQVIIMAATKNVNDLRPRILPCLTSIIQSRDWMSSSAVNLRTKLACKTFNKLIDLFRTPNFVRTFQWISIGTRSKAWVKRRSLNHGFFSFSKPFYSWKWCSHILFLV